MKVRCAHDKLVPIKGLTPHPKNRNQHPGDQIVRLARILEYQGWRYPVKVSNLSGYITSGHGRLLAAKHNGWTEVPVNYQDYESEEQEYADVQSDNAIASWAELDLAGINADLPDLGPDFDIDLLGIKDFVLEPADKYGDQDADEVPEAGKPIVRSGELYVLGGHRLLCGDSTDSAQVQRLMNGEKADMVFTSPPYSDQRDYSGDLDLSIQKLSGIFEWPATLFIVNLGYQRKNNEVNPYWNEWISGAKGKGKRLLSWNIWDRSGFSYTVGQATAMFTIDHEWIFVFGEKPIELNKTVENKQSGVSKSGTQRQKDGNTTPVWTTTGSKRQLGTVIRMDVARYVGDDHTHPAMFPVALPEAYIEAVPCKTVADPFLGSGSTLIACEKTNRKCYGSEIDPVYCDVIIRRWEKFSGQTAYLIEDSNGKLKEPVPYAEIVSSRSTTKDEDRNIVIRRAGEKGQKDEESLA